MRTPCLRNAIALVVLWLAVPHLTWAQCVLLGGVMGILAPLGDLFESLLKRDAMVKDSGAGRLPPFGGILDMIDSPLFAVPAGWWLLSNWARTG